MQFNVLELTELYFHFFVAINTTQSWTFSPNLKIHLMLSWKKVSQINTITNFFQHFLNFWKCSEYLNWNISNNKYLFLPDNKYFEWYIKVSQLNKSAVRYIYIYTRKVERTNDSYKVWLKWKQQPRRATSSLWVVSHENCG